MADTTAGTGFVETRPGEAAPPKGGGRRPARRHLQPWGLPWILPALILSVGLVYYCIGYTGYISTLNWNGTDPQSINVGLQNYLDILGDPVFWMTVEHTVIFFVSTFVLQTVLGIVFAVLLHSRVKLGVLYKVIIFVPVVLAPAIMAPVWRQVFSNSGQLNWILEHLGLGFLAQPWLAQSSTALPAIILIVVWGQTGVNFILYFAAMSQVDQEVLEAARIDGAGNFRVIVSIIWPEVRGTTVALGILSAIGALKLFDVPYLVTVGGPNHATEFLGTYIYEQTIVLSHVGYGAALSIMLLIIAVIMAVVIQLRGRRSEQA